MSSEKKLRKQIKELRAELDRCGEFLDLAEERYAMLSRRSKLWKRLAKNYRRAMLVFNHPSWIEE
jgi:hypothetical protein